MAKVVTDDKHYKAIADAIREEAALPPHDQYNPSEMARGVHDAAQWQYGMGHSDGWTEGYADGEGNGYSVGYQEGHDDGFVVGEQSGLVAGIAQGKQAEYDRMWNMIQQNGNRTSYSYGFIDWGWEYAHPKYKIVPVIDQIAYLFGFNVNLKKAEAQHIDLSQRTSNSDTAQASGNNCVFASCGNLEEVEDIGMLAGYYYRTFRKCSALHTIAVVRFNSTTMIYQMFDNCDSLVNLTVSGTIGQNGLNLQYSTKLSKASITSVVNALSSTTSGLSVTLSKTAVNTAFTTAEWTALANTKKNWTINLV